MSLIDNVRQTITDVAGDVVERGQQISEQARLQVNIKKLQLERARRIHELGTKTFEWYRSGHLTVGGQVPPDVTANCQQLAELQRQLEENERQLEEAKRLAEEAKRQAMLANNPAPPPDTGSPTYGAYGSNPAGTVPPAAPVGGVPTPPPPAAYPSSDKSTAVLNNQPVPPTVPGSNPTVPPGGERTS